MLWDGWACCCNGTKKTRPTTPNVPTHVGVKALQGNSNPFIAEPQLANALYIPSPVLLLEGDAVLIRRGPAPSDVNTDFEFSSAPAGPWAESAVGLAHDKLFVRLKVVLKLVDLDGRT